MTISEMHVWFRQYAQQMGMQNVRAILPEQIDNLINTAIKDTIDEVINKNVGTTNDRVITDNAKLANINALRTLYGVKTIFCSTGELVSSYKNRPYIFGSTLIGDVLYFVDFSIRYGEPKADPENFKPSKTLIGLSNPCEGQYNANKEYYTELLYSIAEDNSNPYSDDVDNPLNICTSAKEALELLNTAMSSQIVGLNPTKWFPVRIIDDSYLADVLNDWVLSPRMRSPVMIIYSNPNKADAVTGGDNIFELYVGDNDSSGINNIASKKYVTQIRCSYIKKPKEVHYLSDVGGTNVDSDLPEQLQIPMLKHAVDLYRVSINGSLYANQQNAQQNQQEIARNNARPDNEGYQS